MNPKDKAIELIEKFDLPTGLMQVEIKQCALICVDEILKSTYKNVLNDLGYKLTINEIDKYWHDVKNEITKL
jgi:hypothetical protein